MKQLRDVFRRIRHLGARQRSLVATCIYGLAGGLSAVAFHLSLHAVYTEGLVRFAKANHGTFLAASFSVVVGTALISGWLLASFCPEASGSGIPQLKLAFWKDFGFLPWRVVWVKFVAGVLSVGGGSSLGREGPSVHLAGALASNLAGALGEAKQSRRGAAAAGAAAGLAAAFNTPLAAVTFVLEEIIQDLNSRWLGRVLLAGIVGALAAHTFLGEQPAFSLSAIAGPSWRAYLLAPLAAALAALVGVVFQRGSLDLRKWQKQRGGVPVWARPAIGAAICWAIGSAVFLRTGSLGVFSLGYDDLSAALEANLSWKLAAVLLFTKLLATIFCYGTGGCGGIFSPTLFFGGMCGAVIAGVAPAFLPLAPADQMALAIVGMTASLGAVVHAPITGIVIVFEMTHEISLLPVLMLGTLVSQGVAKKLARHNFYEEVLRQDGHHLESVIPPRDLQSWQELPISAVANFRPVCWEGSDLGSLLDQHPYQRFPVLQEGSLTGVLTRAAADAARAAGGKPPLEKAVTCFPNETVRDIELRILESHQLLMILVEETGGKVIGLVTIHDLLRAQAAFAGHQRGDT